LRRLDRNRNDILDPDELVGNAGSYLQSLGFDTSQPISLNMVLRKIETDKQDANETKTPTQSSVVRKVPGFGVAETEREGVSKFGGASGGSGIDMNAKYGERVMQLVQRTLDGYDANKNGYLDPDEIKKARWGNPTPEESDTNHDGILTQVELADRYLARDQDARSGGDPNGSADNPSRARTRVTTSNDFSRNRVRTTMPANSTTRQDADGRSSTSRNYTRTTQSRPGSVSSVSSNSDRYARYAAGLMTQYDQDKDGKLNAEELGKMRRPPKNADMDGDGFVTSDELTSSLSGNTASVTPEPAAPVSADPQARAGQTGQPRYSSGRTSNNRSSAAGGRRPLSSFTDYDKNQDGQIQMHEFSEDWDGEIFSQFQAKDLNGDGIITSDEWNGG
jgi:Ca2+-binding EF-hand superfamily protein